MADKGIIFSAPMVRALLDGRKTQTRRLLSLRGYRGFSAFGPSDTAGYHWHFRRADMAWCDVQDYRLTALLPYAPGDRLYVRESLAFDWATGNWHYRMDRTGLKAQAGRTLEVPTPHRWPLGCCNSIHMPRWASRLWLEVTDVRVQRVGEISEADAIAEGVERGDDIFHVDHDHHAARASTSFMALWNSLHTKPGERWEDNPWVVAVSFTVAHGNIDRSPE